MATRFAIGQDSHRFCDDNEKLCAKPFILGGVVFENVPPLSANSDGDVLLHALTNAISGITCKNILGKVADDMCKSGITDSVEYLKCALSDLADKKQRITHVSISIECKTPKISPKIAEMRAKLSEILDVPEGEIGITATTGEGITAFGKGLGIQVFACITTEDF